MLFSGELPSKQNSTNSVPFQALTRSLTSTSSESDNEFLESCRPTSLQAELEDDDEFPEPDDDDDENEDENEDDFEDVLAVVRAHVCTTNTLL